MAERNEKTYDTKPKNGVAFYCKWFLIRLAMNVILYSYSLLVETHVVPTPEDTTNDSSYVPRSRRSKACEWMKRGVEKMGQLFEKYDNEMKHTEKGKTRLRKILRARVDHGKPQNFLRTLACVALVMSAQEQAKAFTARAREATFDTDSGKIGVDNRCTGCISTHKEDFVGPLKASKRVIKGFGGARTTGVMVGTLKWKWTDDTGVLHEFLIPNSFYVDSGEDIRLLSPQHWAQTRKDFNPLQGTRCETDATHVTLSWNQRTCKKTMLLDAANVGTFQSAPGYARFDAFCTEVDIDYRNDTDPIIAMSAKVDQNTPDDATNQKETYTTVIGKVPMQNGKLLDWCKPVEADFDLQGPQNFGAQKVKSLPTVVVDEEDRVENQTPTTELLRLHHRFGHISFSRLQRMAQARIFPRRLADCPVPVCSACLYGKKTRRPWRTKTPATPVEDFSRPIKPGEVVSIDQMVSPTPGLVAQMTGNLTHARYTCATVYVDHATRFGFIFLQKSSSAEETLQSKEAFEICAREHGIKIHHYHADNGIFKAKAWVNQCRSQGQKLTFAGVNAHHQNGIAEKRIRDLQELTRSALIHASKRWPQAITANLWPYAFRQANKILNETTLLKDPAGRSATQLFTNSPVDIQPKHFKPFGCPVAVLHEDLQTGQIFNKWKERSRVGVYLGPSPLHGRNVALVLNMETGHVSPQFHVSFDTSFHIVQQEKWTSQWQEKAGFTAKKDVKDKEKAAPKRQATTGGSQQSGKRRRTTGGAPTAPIQRTSEGQREVDTEVIQTPKQVQISEPSVTTTKSGRKVTKAQRYIETMMAEIKCQTRNSMVEGEIFCFETLYPDCDTTVEDPLLAYKATADPDTMYMHQAMKEHDRGEFIKAMQKEVNDQMENGNFDLIKISEVPKGATILPAVWQMKRKRDIKTRKVKKYKARLNIDGSRMISGIHYDPNKQYAPVASWNSIRMLLTMTALHKWHTQQLDYVLAFPQAPVDREIFMKVPKGFEAVADDGVERVLRLKRNVYGQVQAGRVWNDYLKEKLTNELGFVQSNHDECVFFRGSTMYVLYTDDSILAGPDKKEIEQIIRDIRAAKLDITEEGDLQDFLGINIERRKDGTIHLTQPHLIDQILKELRLDKEGTKAKSTPAACSKILGRHSESPDFDGAFDYRSVIGKLNYLERGTRSDIAYIVHQCARFTACPKVEHAEALKWLGRYLHGTRNKGTILRPKSDHQLEVYVDADFVGNWNVEEADQRDTARSRHGYYIMYAGCPVSWKSQLQGEICLSSTESEYTGLSYALREAIPLMGLLQEMKEHGFPVHSTQSQVHCRVFEDNSGALEMAKIHKYRPRTKHLCVKLHHFRDYVVQKKISIHPIDTLEQLADCLTKPLNEKLHVKHRKTVLGW